VRIRCFSVTDTESPDQLWSWHVDRHDLSDPITTALSTPGPSEYFHNSSGHNANPPLYISSIPLLSPFLSRQFSPSPFPPVFFFRSPPLRTHMGKFELGYITYDQAYFRSFLDDSDGSRSYPCCHRFVKVQGI
jgi:hypothetical protein